MNAISNSYEVGQIVVVRSIPDGYCEVPCEVLTVSEYRCDVRFAFGNTENIGIGNIRQAPDWQVSDFHRMRAECKRRAEQKGEGSK